MKDVWRKEPAFINNASDVVSRSFVEIVVGFSAKSYLSSSRQLCGEAEGLEFKWLVPFASISFYSSSHYSPCSHYSSSVPHVPASGS
jgi:hypothetical protein